MSPVSSLLSILSAVKIIPGLQSKLVDGVAVFVMMTAVTVPGVCIAYIDIDDSAISDVQILNERVERVSFGMNLTTAGLSLQQDHLANRAKVDRFLVSGLKQTGRPAVDVAAQKTAGHAIMTSLLEKKFPGSDCPCIRNVSVYIYIYIINKKLHIKK